ncbi:unnamed protein product [Sphagnum jensenii]
MLHKELGLYKAQVDRQSNRNSELNTTVHALNLQLGILQSDRLITQTSLYDDVTTQDLISMEKKVKKHNYRASDEVNKISSNAATPRSRISRLE